MRIHVYLPASRQLPGWLHVFNDAGAHVAAMQCLGKADNAKAAAKGNPSRNPIHSFGDTPTGRFAPTKVEIFKTRHDVMGDGWIPLTGATGEALLASEVRTGLAIHGGRGDDRLVPTYGCIRVYDKDWARLVDLIGSANINVTVENL